MSLEQAQTTGQVIEIARLASSAPGFADALSARLQWTLKADDATAVVGEIIAQVRAQGDAALLAYTERFDHHTATDIAALTVAEDELQRARQRIPAAQRTALEAAAARIRHYAERQRLESWSYTEADGSVFGQRITALDRAGLYVPGGRAAYPSSVLMNALPARVAGVREITMVAPTPHGERNDLVLAAAAIAGVDRVITIGGAQAIAALAYGTESIAAVDKIVGPGNRYVAAAKRMVFGTVGIDIIAGPSEICIICDGHSDPDWIAMDLFSQAEHDEDAQAILLSWDANFLDAVHASCTRLLGTMPRAQTIRDSLRTRGALIHTRDLDDALEIANYIAPEHLELALENATDAVSKVHNAGAIFVGQHTAEVFGDYCAGPNHVLPTARSARFSSPLGVYDFQKRSSIVACSPAGAAKLATIAEPLARGEGLVAHAESARYRRAAAQSSPRD